jgi:hypothetical protein
VLDHKICPLLQAAAVPPTASLGQQSPIHDTTCPTPWLQEVPPHSQFHPLGALGQAGH